MTLESRIKIPDFRLPLWSPDVKSPLTGKDPDARKDLRQKEKGAAEDEMVKIASLT